jgi:hypothetical protein
VVIPHVYSVRSGTLGEGEVKARWEQLVSRKIQGFFELFFQLFLWV